MTGTQVAWLVLLTFCLAVYALAGVAVHDHFAAIVGWLR